MTETKGYRIYVDAGSSGVDWKTANEFKERIQRKHGVLICFPIQFSGRYAHNPQGIDIPRRDLNLLDDVLDIVKKNYFGRVEGIERIVT
jgi:hypothetical protein